jgi:hypothetical protein
MSFASETGYIPQTVDQLMSVVRENINTQFGTSYDDETFLGTNFYKYFYALIQRLQQNEVKTAEIFTRMQEYFVTTNEKIQRPNTTHPGLQSYFLDRGYLISTKEPIDADAGKLYVAVNVDSLASDYAARKLDIATILKDCVAAGIVTQGTQVQTIALPNAQSFDFKFYLPHKIPVKLRLTITQSSNNQFTILSTAETSALLQANIAARYRLGLDFEPRRYFSIIDAPWAADVLLEWSDDGGTTWHSTVYAANFDDLFTFGPADITIVET